MDLPEKNTRTQTAPEAPVFERAGETALAQAEGREMTRPGKAPAARTDGSRYRQLVSKYKKRQHDSLVDTVTTGLSYADEVAVDLGLVEDTGLLGEMTDMVSSALPFAVIAVTEQAKVIMGKKSQKEALKNTFFRMVKTGAAMGAGALAGAVGGLPAAIPAAIGVRALMDHYKSKSMLGSRISGRTKRLAELKERMEKKKRIEDMTLGTGGDRS